MQLKMNPKEQNVPEDPRLIKMREESHKKRLERREHKAKEDIRIKKGYKKIIAGAGPKWYMEMSIDQLIAVDTLVMVMRDDMSECQSYRTINQLVKIGVWPKPNSCLVLKALKESKGQVLAMLFVLFKSFGNKDPYVKYQSYTMNEMIVLSAVAHLTLGTAIRDLDFRLPEQLPRDAPSELWIAKNYQEPSRRPPVSPLWKNKNARLRVYLEPQPWAKFPVSQQLTRPNTLASCLTPYDKPSDGLYNPRPIAEDDHKCGCSKNNVGNPKQKKKKGDKPWSSNNVNVAGDPDSDAPDPYGDASDENKSKKIDADGSKENSKSTIVMRATMRSLKSPFKEMAAIMEHSPEECKAIGCMQRYDAIKKQLQSEWCGCGRPIIPGMSRDKKNKRKRSPLSKYSNSRRGDPVKMFIKNAIWDAAYMDPDIIEKLYQVSVAYDKDDSAATSAKDGQEHPGGEGEEYDATSINDPDACPGDKGYKYSPEEQEYIDRLQKEQSNYTLSKNLKQQKKTLLAVLEAMRADDILIAKLPDAHKIPYLKMFVQMRCGYRMTTNIIEKLLLSTRANMYILRKSIHSNVRCPTPEQVTCAQKKCGCDESYLENYDFHDRMTARADVLLKKYKTKLRQLYVKEAQVFWPLMENIRNCTSMTRPTFFDYFPGRELDIYTFRPWNSREKHARSFPCGRQPCKH